MEPRPSPSPTIVRATNPPSSSGAQWVHHCERCGEQMEERQCKIVCNNCGRSVILGHAHPAIVEAVRRRVASGSNFAYLTDASLELAEELARAVPCAERLRFCASGTEATAYAVRLARAFTGRSRVLKFEGAYHGANEVGTVSLFPRRLLAFPQGEPTSAGIPAGAVADVLVAPYNDLRATTAILTAHRHDVAAVIVEPLHRCTPPRPGFLAGLRELTAELGALL